VGVGVLVFVFVPVLAAVEAWFFFLFFLFFLDFDSAPTMLAGVHLW